MEFDGGSWLQDNSLLVYAAMACQASGLVLRRQIALRCMVLLGSGLYIGYYFSHTPEPLWDAIIASTVIGSATLIGILRLLSDGLPFLTRKRHLEVYEAFDDIYAGAMMPGQFRRLMRHARIATADERCTVTERGRVPSGLYFVVKGRTELRKGYRTAELEGSRFIGSIAFVTGGVALDDSWILPGTHYVRWSTQALHRQLAADLGLERGLHALVSRDMACKLARSFEFQQPAARRRIPRAEADSADHAEIYDLTDRRDARKVAASGIAVQ